MTQVVDGGDGKVASGRNLVVPQFGMPAAKRWQKCPDRGLQQHPRGPANTTTRLSAKGPDDG